MIASAAPRILEDLVESKTIESKVMIVVAHPDDETIGMGAQLCRFNDTLLVQVTDGAPRTGAMRMPTDTPALRNARPPGGSS
jgi:N-acetylglucosamine malate deacetylase 2